MFFERSKTKGGTLGWKKYFFQKSSQINSRIGLKIPQKYFRNKNMFKIGFWPMQPCARSVHALLSRRSACTERSQGCMGQNTFLNMYLFLKYFCGIFKPILELIWELFWKKYFFLPRVPPLVFERSKNIKSAWQGVKTFFSHFFFADIF